MRDLEENIKKVNTKLKILKLAENDNDRILSRNENNRWKHIYKDLKKK